MKKFLTVEIPNNRVFGLDLLRCLAILFVIIDHSLIYLPDFFHTIWHILNLDGVSIFFVLSGFLIGGILIKSLHQKTFYLIDFWKRRWWRTLPNYFFILILLTTISVLQGGSLIKKIPFFFFLQNLKTPHPFWFPEAWSLAVEEWFYLLTPLFLIVLIYFFKIKAKTSILICIISIIVISTLFRVYRFSFNIKVEDIQTWDLWFRKQVITRLDSIMFGVAAAFVKFYHFSFWKKYNLYFFVIGLILFICNSLLFCFLDFNNIFLSVFNFTVVAIATSCTLPLLSEWKNTNSLLSKPIILISLISYSMYLVNYSLVREWIIPNITFLQKLDSFYSFLAFLFLVFLISILLYKYLEIPTTKLRDRFN